MGESTMSVSKHLVVFGAAEWLLASEKRSLARFTVVDRAYCYDNYATNRPERLLLMEYADPSLPDMIAAIHREDPFHGALLMSDDALIVGATIAAALGLECASAEATAQLKDKSLMRTALQSEKSDAVEFERVHSLDGIAAFADRVEYPIIVKPTNSVGSYLVKKIENLHDAKRYWDEHWQGKGQAILAEKFIEGTHFGILTFSFAGRLLIIGIVRIFHDPAIGHGSWVSIGQYVPGEVTQAQRSAIAATLSRALSTLGIEDGPCWTEIRINGESIKIVESQNRLPGGFIPQLIRHSTGIDVYNLLIEWGVRERGSVDEKVVRAAEALESMHSTGSGAAIRFYTPQPGRVMRVTFPEPRPDAILRSEIYIQTPGVAPVVTRDIDRIGYALAISDIGKDAYEAASNFVESTKFEYEAMV
ncbi:ATP-grasp domain-containing protein [Rhizobium mongolense USDA 1844]|uniref:ATP-grasp domain-containing protein n=2 Tax=Rhizobium mongolense TaxID=57676 RepID=A0A559TKM3_9HYPH|nr:ATP-grasp domain-containing protein [Rhizobium mongolense USDA 1844]